VGSLTAIPCRPRRWSDHIQGIGRATGRAFAERGPRVVVAARRADVLEELAQHARQPAAKP